MANTFTPTNLAVVGNVYSVSIPTMHLPEGTGQTFLKGDIVKFSSGRIVVAADTDSGAVLAGQAAQDASGTAGTLIEVVPFLPGTIIEANLTQTAGSYAAQAADADFGVGYGLGLTTAHVYYIDQDVPVAALASAKTAFAFPFAWAYARNTSGVWVKSAAGDTDARVQALILNSAFIDRVDTNIAS